LIRENANTINTINAKDNEKSQKVNWWINELDSLGMKKSNSNDKKESTKSQELEDLTDDIKQKFIYDYKIFSRSLKYLYESLLCKTLGFSSRSHNSVSK